MTKKIREMIEAEISTLQFDEPALLKISIEHAPEGEEQHTYAAAFRIGFRHGYKRGAEAGAQKMYDILTAEHEKKISKTRTELESLSALIVIFRANSAINYSEFELIMKKVNAALAELETEEG